MAQAEGRRIGVSHIPSRTLPPPVPSSGDIQWRGPLLRACVGLAACCLGLGSAGQGGFLCWEEGAAVP